MNASYVANILRDSGGAAGSETHGLTPPKNVATAFDYAHLFRTEHVKVLFPLIVLPSPF